MNYSDKELIESYTNLSETLNKTLTRLSPNIELFRDNAYPVLIMKSDLNITGFGITSADPSKEYDLAYNHFKKLYSKNRNDWSNSNISYVVCKEKNRIIADDFFNKIETDLYFCRKFVLSLGPNFTHELERLPFVPLDRDSVVVPKRPKSAQFLIQELGASAELSRNIALPNKRKSTLIVDDCLKLPKTLEIKKLPEDIYQKGSSEAKSPTRVKSIKITNFRAYKGEHTFDLDADLVLIYGQNGLGKTSFFDAVDFVSTGGCGRFKQTSPRGDEKFRNIANHLDTKPEETSVELNLSQDAQSIKLIRNLSSHSKAQVNNSLLDRTDTLLKIVGAEEGEIENRIETITNLFRSTHLFGQDFQTLTENFSKTSSLSLETVSQMLAFQDYVRSDSKLGEVQAVLTQKIKALNDELNNSTKSTNEIKEKLASLQNTTSAFETPESLNQWIESFLLEVKQKINIPVRSETENLNNYIRTIRSFLEGKIKNSEGRVQKIISASDQIQKFNANTSKIGNLNEQQKELESEIEKIGNELKKIELEASESKTLLDNSKSSETLELKNLESLNWFISKFTERSEFHTKKNLLTESLGELQKQLNEKQGELSSVEVASLENQKEKEKISSIHSSITYRTGELTKLLSTHAAYIDSKNKTSFYEDQVKKIEQDSAIIKHELDLKLSELSVLETERQSKGKELEEIQKNEDKIHSLVEELKNHVENEHCPACGIKHQSVEAVIEALTNQTSGQSEKSKNYFKIVRELDEKITNLKTFITSKSNILINSASDIGLIIKNSEEAKKISADFEKALSLQKIQLDERVEMTLKGVIDACAIDLKKSLEDLNAVSEKLLNSLSRKQVIETEIEQIKNSLSSINTNIVKTDQLIQSDLSECARRGIDSSMNLETASALLVKLEKALHEVRDRIRALEEKLQSHQLQEIPLKSLLEQLNHKKTLQLKETQLVQKEMTSFAQLLKEAQLSDNVSFDDLISLKKDVESENSQCRLWVTQAITAETALDAAETTLEFSRLQDESKKSDELRKNIRDEIQILSNWDKFFLNVKNRLSKVRDDAVSDYTKQYGPLTSVIQNRLRSVYSFGEIGLEADKGSIDVTVKRGESNLRPIDYFSESQKQILVLSLFFASAITQNWSSFSPIFLDDPVTHFDDLNAYAFLDLISGMLQSEKGHRQFVISTCDDRLFQLMRAKFRNFGDRVKIYEFLAIGENGPVWQNVPNGQESVLKLH